MKHLIITSITVVSIAIIGITACNKKPIIEPELPQESHIAFVTEKKEGEKIRLLVDAAKADRSGCWIDLNGNETQDKGEVVTDFDNNVIYTLGSQTIKVYGNITNFECVNNKITSIDVSKSAALEVLSCGENSIENIDVSNNIKLIWLSCSSNKISSLDISSNKNLQDLWIYKNQIKNPAMTSIVNSLPKRPDSAKGNFNVYEAISGTDGNVCTKTNADVAREKGWNVQQRIEDYKWVPYQGM